MISIISTIFSVIWWSLVAIFDSLPVILACLIVAGIFTLIIHYIVFH